MQGCRSMDKLDIFFYIPLTFILRMTLTLSTLASAISSYIYNYWFHTSDNAQLRFDLQAWLLFIILRVTLTFIYVSHLSVKFWMVACQVFLMYFQLLPGTSILLFWPKFYRDILLGPGRSIFAILCDPQYTEDDETNQASQVPRETKRKFLQKGRVKIQPTHAQHYLHSSYQVEGAWSHLATSGNKYLTSATEKTTTILYCDDPLRLSVIYEYVAMRIPELPDNDLQRGMTCFAILCIFMYPVVRAFFLLPYHKFLGQFKKPPTTKSSENSNNDESIFMPGPRGFILVNADVSSSKPSEGAANIALTTDRVSWDKPEEDVQNGYNFDSDGISFVIDNSATCIICNDRTQFVGDLERQDCHVETSVGKGKCEYLGTLRVHLTDDAGTTSTYDIPGAVYDPTSPFNILGIPYLGDFFGSNDDIPSSDDDGTWIRSSANYSFFVWDHGKHERHFQHSSRRLPELTLETGFKYFSSFCTRVRRTYHDNIHFAFSSAYSVDEETEEDVHVIETDFVLGMNLIYNDGEGTIETVVYEGASADNLQHTVRRKDGNRLLTPGVFLQLLDQPDLSNIPKTPLDYCKEVGVGLSREEVQELAYPRLLTPIQQELMSWHYRLYHLPFNRLFQLAQRGILPKYLLEAQDKPPLCIACQFGTAHRRPWRFKGKKQGSIRRKEHKEPGDGTSIDQIVSAQPGFIPQMSGYLTSDRIWGATTFCDHVTDFVYVHLMRNFTLAETLLAKTAYEKLLAQMNHRVKHYHADNGRFSDNGFLKSCNDHDQKITFCGVGAHHQNGIIENKNKQLTLGARTLLLHGIRMWPQMIDIMFWPFAMKAFAERMNALHFDLDGNTPESRMYGVKNEDPPIKSFHTLFCPVYVLDHRLQSAGGAGPPKWEPRSRIGVYLGHSPFHAGSVALVFNPRTGHVSPQYHVVFDDDFTTVPFMEKGERPPNWVDLCRQNAESSTDESVDLALEWLSGMTDVDGKDSNVGEASQAMGSKLTDPFAVVFDQAQHAGGNKPQETENNSDVSRNLITASEGEELSPSSLQSRKRLAAAALNKPNAKRGRVDSKAGFISDLGSAFEAVANDDSRNNEEDTEALLMPQRVNLQEAGLRRSDRIREKKNSAQAKNHKAHVTFGSRIKKAVGMFTILCTVNQYTMPNHQLAETSTPLERMVNRLDEANELYDGTLNNFNHISLTSDVSSNETFTYQTAMKQDDWPMFVQAMEKEIDDHESRNHWSLVPRASLPRTAKTIKAIWSFKRKRFPDGTLNKHKARICAHGGMQEWGENYWETYSPVVNMLSVKLLLVIAKIHGLESKSIDFVLAFPQADLDVDVWMELPVGFDPEGISQNQSRQFVLKLNANLYGLKQASFNWFEKLKQGLLDRNFVPSKIDPCVYLKNGMIVLCYVDDCIIIGNKMKDINDFVYSMQNGPENFVLTDEGNIDKFLGIEIKDRGLGEFEMCQPHLIDRILSFLELESNGHDTSTSERLTPSNAVLNKDLAGKPRKRSWKYRTGVGMLSYLQANTRPDISMSVHQTARYCIDPRLSHEQAIMRIGRYLRHSRNRGIIYKPDRTKGLECYVDADFAGGWKQDEPEDAGNLFSRMGYVIKYAGCPIYWRSALEGEITLSTAESEYVALSNALREVIPLMTLMEEINDVFPLYIDKPNFFCKVWEDNQSCIAMATTQKFSPRTKHIALKYHHFRSFVNGTDPKIRINYVHTEEQQADIFTKPVKPDLFPKLRFLLMGW